MRLFMEALRLGRGDSSLGRSYRGNAGASPAPFRDRVPRATIAERRSLEEEQLPRARSRRDVLIEGQRAGRAEVSLPARGAIGQVERHAHARRRDRADGELVAGAADRTEPGPWADEA